MTYLINDVFFSIQGEGYWSGRPAVFVRFAKCNLWTGREEHRATATCTFCDTDFTKGTRYSLEQLIAFIYAAHTPLNRYGCVTDDKPMIVLTGGEPGLQVDTELIDALHGMGYYIAIETNGTQLLPDGIDWVCVSPKTPTVVIDHGDELKLVYPQQNITPELFGGHAFKHFWLSPMDGPNLAANTKAAFDYCLAHPQWRLNTQVHKTIGVK